MEIRKVIWAMDMPGRARGGLLANTFNPPRPPGWNDQVTEPVYAWNNGAMHIVTNTPNIHEGEHYHNNTPMPGYTPYVYPHPLVSGDPSPPPGSTPPSGSTLPLLRSPATTRSSLRRPWGGKKQQKTEELKKKASEKVKQSPANERVESQEKLGN